MVLSSAVAKRSTCRASRPALSARASTPLDVYTNGEWKGRYDLKITAGKDGKMGVCYTKAMLMQYGISPEKLNPQLSEKRASADACRSGVTKITSKTR
ncbi:hypothetical protein LNP20_00455 [Klebsiella pneumoniae subsp. pneumoniae]|nr:hypothetical protein [Klebsiella pneumoniae subsp. pneumoniae]